MDTSGACCLVVLRLHVRRMKSVTLNSEKGIPGIVNMVDLKAVSMKVYRLTPLVTVNICFIPVLPPPFP
jgi:hypothetical protein